MAVVEERAGSAMVLPIRESLPLPHERSIQIRPRRWQVGERPARRHRIPHGYLGVPDWVQGAQWHYPGFGSLPCAGGKNRPSGDPGCACIAARFAVDPFGRIFRPNPFLFSVEVLDTNGNCLMRVGRYSNADSAGPSDKVPQPEVAFAFPFAASIRSDSLFVSDPINQRVVTVKFEQAVSAECIVP